MQHILTTRENNFATDFFGNKKNTTTFIEQGLNWKYNFYVCEILSLFLSTSRWRSAPEALRDRCWGGHLLAYSFMSLQTPLHHLSISREHAEWEQVHINRSFSLMDFFCFYLPLAFTITDIFTVKCFSPLAYALHIETFLQKRNQQLLYFGQRLFR